MALVEPVPIEPPGTPDAATWTDNITRIGTNLQNNLETIAQVPLDVVHGVDSGLNALNDWLSNPKAPSPGLPPILGPSEQATIPAADPPVTVPINNPYPNWVDTFNWAGQTAKPLAPDLTIATPVIGPQLEQALNAYMGQTIKALSGSINQTLNLATLASDVLAQRIKDTQTVIGALNDNQALTNAQLHQILSLITDHALPQLWHEIERLHAQLQGTATAVLHDAQVWVNTNVRFPLEENLGAEKANRIAQVDGVIQSIPGEIVARVGAMGLATAASVAGLAARVATLEQEATDCTMPMCDVMGPKTDLGKLFKALSVAGDLALLAELGSMTEAQLVDLLRTLASKFAGFVGDLDSMFIGGGETLASFITNEVAKYV